ncbi:hypothetical protein GQ43DRAFT_296906 [Delitschia confertaspora ATCC 74209]|uniref:Uncharacterized protein n=1 Tax=Delitschia confertaspora ATCC 74209 TaxID=1513339 RepID=A0A9P4MMC2_9PLEO|nr:hypothetical protein GQ43DRAFT_296906 [Delitschia confertaspora ATCC 74209]
MRPGRTLLKWLCYLPELLLLYPLILRPSFALFVPRFRSCAMGPFIITLLSQLSSFSQEIEDFKNFKHFRARTCSTSKILETTKKALAKMESEPAEWLQAPAKDYMQCLDKAKTLLYGEWFLLLLGQINAFTVYYEILQQDKQSFAGRPKQRRNERQRVRDTTADLFTAVGKEVFLLCTIAVSV